MKCPDCSEEIAKERSSDGSTVFRCRKCGWGAARPDPPPPPPGEFLDIINDADPAIPAGVWIKLPVFLFISTVIVVGPYYAMVYGLPWIGDYNGWPIHPARPEVLELLNPEYWIFMFIYIGLADILSTVRPGDNMGLFGTWIDNPFSYEDDFNRFLAIWLFVLLPGRFVAATLSGVCKLAYRLATGSRGPTYRGQNRSKKYRSRRD